MRQQRYNGRIHPKRQAIMNTTKFYLLPVGQRFEYQGEAYVKTTPLIASGAEGRQKFMPRSATVLPLGEVPPAAAEPGRTITVEMAGQALAEYHVVCMGVLERLSAQLEGEALAAAQRELEAAYAEGLGQLTKG